MNYPTRPQSPNGYQILGNLISQGGQIAGQFGEAQAAEADRQNRLQILMQDAAEKRAAAQMLKIKADREAAEEAKKIAEADKSRAAMEEFKTFQGGQTAALPPSIPDPRNGTGPDGEIAGPAPLQYETQKPTRQAMMDKALELGVYGDSGIQAYFKDTKPTKNPLTQEESLELYKAKKEIDAAILAGRPLSPYQKMMMDVYKDRIENGEEGRAFQKERFAKEQENQDTDRETKFVKNTNELKTELDMFGKLDKAVPGGIYGTGGVSGFGFGTAPLRKFWKTAEANAIRPTLQFLINAILKRQSGAAVSDQEFERLNTAFGINTTGTMEEFRNGLQNYYESSKGQYDRLAKADKRSAGKIDAAQSNLNPAAKETPAGRVWIRDPKTGKLVPK